MSRMASSPAPATGASVVRYTSSYQWKALNPPSSARWVSSVKRQFSRGIVVGSASGEVRTVRVASGSLMSAVG